MHCRLCSAFAIALILLIAGEARLGAQEDIYTAILNKDYAAVESALDAGALVNGYNEAGFAPLHVATRANHVQIIQLLINRGAEVNIKSQAKTGSGQTPLHIAAALGNRQTINQLLLNNADPNIQDENGNTSLHNAVANNDARIVRQLIAGGADVEIKNSSGKTAGEITSDPDVLKVLGGAITVVEQRNIGLALFITGVTLNILPLTVGLPVIGAVAGESVAAGIGGAVFTQLVLGQLGIITLASIPFFTLGPVVGMIATSAIILTTTAIFMLAPIDINVNNAQITVAQKAYGSMIAASVSGLAMWIVGLTLWVNGNQRITNNGVVLSSQDSAATVAFSGTQLTIVY